jgi:hypothetical protein
MVGGPSDKSCELEGIYDIVATRRHELSRQLEQFERRSAGLLDRIQLEQSSEPIRPIIMLPSPSILECEDDVSTTSAERIMHFAEPHMPVKR